MLNPQKLPPEEEFFLKSWVNKSREEQEEIVLRLFRSNQQLAGLAAIQHRSIQEKIALIAALKKLKDTPRREPLVLPDFGEK